MTVYVDNMLLQAQVGRLNARWSHLMSDNKMELIDFATEKLGMKIQWIQGDNGRLDRLHFDVTKTKRDLAIREGAIALEWRQMGELLRALRVVDADKNLRTRFSNCFSCDESTVLTGPWCDAANDEMWLCGKCEEMANA